MKIKLWRKGKGDGEIEVVDSLDFNFTMSGDYTDVLGTDVRLPHCDSLILHKPGTCEFCDRHPAWQQYRSAAGIAFSNDTDEHVREHYLVPCPSTVRRTAELRDRWPGNNAAARGGFIGGDRG